MEASNTPPIEPANTQTQAPATPIANVPPVSIPVENSADAQIEAEEKSEKIQWITLLILGLSITSLVMSIVNSKKQIENLEKGDKGRDNEIKELKLNLKKLMGNKYETIDE
jgi:hypothetical protein